MEMSPHTLCGNEPNKGGVVVGSEVKVNEFVTNNYW